MPFKRRRAQFNKINHSLQGGVRSCACMASYKCGEGVHPVREIHSHSERSEESRAITVQQTQILSGSFEQSSQDDRGKYNGLVGTSTSLKDDCKKLNVLSLEVHLQAWKAGVKHVDN